jgi:hypothetical protein
MCSACANIRPPASKMAQEASIRSFMFGEYAVRFKAAPISSGIAVNAFFKIFSVMGFMISDIAC